MPRQDTSQYGLINQLEAAARLKTAAIITAPETTKISSLLIGMGENEVNRTAGTAECKQYKEAPWQWGLSIRNLARNLHCMRQHPRCLV